MSESPIKVISDFSVGIQTETAVSPTKNELIDPRVISKKTDQQGRDKLSAEVRETRQIRDEIKNTESKLVERQEILLVKIKNKLNIPDKQTVELQAQILEARTKQDKLPNPKQMVEAYYEKVAETPLTNQEKRDLLKPEVLSQLSMEEYAALWKRLNPYFLAHVTRQGFRDHNAMIYHSAGLQEFHNGFLNIVNDEKQLRPPLALGGLKSRDETSVKMFLSGWVLQSENEEEAKKRFNDLLHMSWASAPKYQDSTAVHFATQIVANDYYGGETNNEVFFAFPSDVLASQHDFTFNGLQKDFTNPQSETKWNDVFIWPKTLENPGISIDTGVVFLPENAKVDPNTGSKYASEAKVIDGKERRVMVENTDLINKFTEWSKNLTADSEIIKMAHRYVETNNYYTRQSIGADIDDLCLRELQSLGFDKSMAKVLIDPLTYNLINWGEKVPLENLQKLIDESSAKFKLAENPISAKEYWEGYFAKNPNLRPKHVIFYSGDPTTAIYRFQKQNGIGAADTSKTEGQLLGFDDHHVVDIQNDPRANQGHQELVSMGNKIIEEHYRNKI